MGEGVCTKDRGQQGDGQGRVSGPGDAGSDLLVPGSSGHSGQFLVADQWERNTRDVDQVDFRLLSPKPGLGALRPRCQGGSCQGPPTSWDWRPRPPRSWETGQGLAEGSAF